MQQSLFTLKINDYTKGQNFSHSGFVGFTDFGNKNDGFDTGQCFLNSFFIGACDTYNTFISDFFNVYHGASRSLDILNNFTTGADNGADKALGYPDFDDSGCMRFVIFPGNINCFSHFTQYVQTTFFCLGQCLFQ